MVKPRSFWVAGASSGLGLAMVRKLLEQGHRVAASANGSQQLDMMSALHRKNLLRLPGQLQDAAQARAAAEELQSRWGALDGLIINAGTCDYLPESLDVSELLSTLVTTNLQASLHCLDNAQLLLAKGDRPQVMAIVSRHSALQLEEPTQLPSGQNSLPQLFRERRPTLRAQGIDLTVVAPQSLKTLISSAQAIPEQWTPEKAAAELVDQLSKRKAELVLEVLDTDSLWPLE